MNKNLPILLILVLVAGCAVWPLGEDPKGKEYKNQAIALVKSLVQYKKENGELPQSLEALAPKYIPELPEMINFVFYSKEKESLMYSYTPSWPQQGRTSCFTIIGSAKWECHGYI